MKPKPKGAKYRNLYAWRGSARAAIDDAIEHQ